MVLNPAGLVWMGRRIVEEGSEIADSPNLWQMPQGGIDGDEPPYAAALRELYEETGMRSCSLLQEAPGWLDYDLPPNLVGVAFKGRYRGQRQKWFALRFSGDDSEIAVNPRLKAAHRELYDAYRAELAEDIAAVAKPRGRDVDAPALARNFIALVDGLWLEWCLDESVVTPQAAEAAGFEMLEAQVGPLRGA